MAVLTMDEVVYTYRNKYQTVYALNGVSGEFNRGRFHAITGRSGSGKSTLMSLLAGLELPARGTIRYEGTPTTDLDRNKYRRDCAAVIYQSFNLFPLLTARENVMYPLKLKKVEKEKCRAYADEMLVQVGLTKEYAGRFPAQLSGGEQQRVAIARALAADAPVILADEPTGNLDSGNGKHIVEILKHLAHEKNRCVIVVTHDMAIANEADEVFRMEDGRFV